MNNKTRRLASPFSTALRNFRAIRIEPRLKIFEFRFEFANWRRRNCTDGPILVHFENLASFPLERGRFDASFFFFFEFLLFLVDPFGKHETDRRGVSASERKPVNQIRDKERKKRNARVHGGEKKGTKREGKGGMRGRRGGKNIIGNRSGVRIPNESAFNNPALENQRKFAGHARSAFFPRHALAFFPLRPLSVARI